MYFWRNDDEGDGDNDCFVGVIAFIGRDCVVGVEGGIMNELKKKTDDLKRKKKVEFKP